MSKMKLDLDSINAHDEGTRFFSLVQSFKNEIHKLRADYKTLFAVSNSYVNTIKRLEKALEGTKNKCSGHGSMKGKCKNEYHTHAPYYCLGCYDSFIKDLEIKELKKIKDHCDKCGTTEFLCGHNKRD